jgi:hypothetical protein
LTNPTFHVVDLATGCKVEARGEEMMKIAAKEEWAKGLIYCDLEAWALQDDGTLILTDECGNFAYPPEGRFCIHFDEAQ